MLLQLGLVLGLFLAAFLVIGLHFGARLFTDDVDVIHLIGVGIPVHIQLPYMKIFLTHIQLPYMQPVNALAFVGDGVNFGASDLSYSAYSMICFPDV